MSMPTSKKGKKDLVLSAVLDELAHLELHQEPCFLDSVYLSIEDAVYDSIPSKTGYFSSFQLKKANALIKELQENVPYFMYRAVEASLRRSTVKKKKTNIVVKRKKSR